MSDFTRDCPNCGCAITHRSRRSCRQCEREERLCRSCGAKARIKKYGYGDAFSEFTKKGCNTGSDNPFYGKTHSEETKEKIRNRDKSFFKSPQYKKKMSDLSKGSNNPMYGVSFYDKWVCKYGKLKADDLMDKFREKQSRNNSGENNNMFGKPSPQGSGNGWSGWYKGWFFRSLLELSYMIRVIEKEGHSWISAETSNLRIKYEDWNGNQRTYCADFFLDEQMLVECKPTRLHKSKSVILKQKAAIDFCDKKGYVYVLTDCDRIKDEEIKSLRKAELVKFTDRYEKKFQDHMN